MIGFSLPPIYECLFLVDQIYTLIDETVQFLHILENTIICLLQSFNKLVCFFNNSLGHDDKVSLSFYSLILAKISKFFDIEESISKPVTNILSHEFCVFYFFELLLIVKSSSEIGIVFSVFLAPDVPACFI